MPCDLSDLPFDSYGMSYYIVFSRVSIVWFLTIWYAEIQIHTNNNNIESWANLKLRHLLTKLKEGKMQWKEIKR